MVSKNIIEVLFMKRKNRRLLHQPLPRARQVFGCKCNDMQAEIRCADGFSLAFALGCFILSFSDSTRFCLGPKFQFADKH